MFNQTELRSSFFCDKEIKVGQAVEIVPYDQLTYWDIKNNIVKILPGQNGYECIGVSLNDIVSMNMSNYRCYDVINWKLPGAKIDILREGIIRVQMEYKIDIGKKIYYDKDGNLTTNAQIKQNPIGYVYNSYDSGINFIYIRAFGVNKE